MSAIDSEIVLRVVGLTALCASHSVAAVLTTSCHGSKRTGCSNVRYGGRGRPINLMPLDSILSTPAPGFALSRSVMTVSYLDDGDAGAEYSIDNMRALVDRALKSPQIYQLARLIVAHVPAFDEAGEVQALYQWVLQNIRFTKGVIGKQSLQTADATLRMRQGQCTDISILLAALMMSIGYAARFVAVATDPGSPDQFSHIYPEVKLSGAWIPIDAARSGAQFGVIPERVFRSQAFDVLDDVGNMPHLGDTASDIANTIAATGTSAAQIITAANTPPAYVLVNGQFVSNPNYAAATGAQPILQNTSQATGIPSLLLLGIGVFLLYSFMKR